MGRPVPKGVMGASDRKNYCTVLVDWYKTALFVCVQAEHIEAIVSLYMTMMKTSVISQQR